MDLINSFNGPNEDADEAADAPLVEVSSEEDPAAAAMSPPSNYRHRLTQQEFSDLVARYKNGEPQPLIVRIEKNFREMARVIIKKRGLLDHSQITVEDLTSEAKFFLLEGLNKGTITTETPPSWMFRRAKNRMFDYIQMHSSSVLSQRAFRGSIQEIASFEAAAHHAHAFTYMERATLAQSLGTTLLVHEKRVLKVFGVSSLDDPVRANDSESDTLVNLLSDNPLWAGKSIQDVLNNQLYLRFLIDSTALSDLEYYVIFHRYLNPNDNDFGLSQSDVAQCLELNASRISQIENAVIKKLRETAKLLKRDGKTFEDYCSWIRSDAKTLDGDFEMFKKPDNSFPEPVNKLEKLTLHGRPTQITNTSNLKSAHVTRCFGHDHLPVLVANGKKHDILGILVTPRVAEILSGSDDFNPQEIDYKQFSISLFKHSEQGRKAVMATSRGLGVTVVFVPIPEEAVAEALLKIERHILPVDSDLNPLATEDPLPTLEV